MKAHKIQIIKQDHKSITVKIYFDSKKWSWKKAVVVIPKNEIRRLKNDLDRI